MDFLLGFKSTIDSIDILRTNIWNDVLKGIHDKNFLHGKQFQTKRRIDFVPPEWKEIYGAYYEEVKNLTVSEVEKDKITKDIHRTFGLFNKNDNNTCYSLMAIDLISVYLVI